MVLPILSILLLAIVQFGIVFNHYVQLTTAASAGARQLTISRGSATPYSSTVSAIRFAAPNLASSSITSTLTVGGVTCTSDNTACQAAFGTGTAPVQAQVALSYPCTIGIFNIVLGSCALNSSSVGVVQ